MTPGTRRRGALAKLARDPDHANACKNLGILVAMCGDLGDAAQLFERAVPADPTNRNAAGNLVRAKAMLQR